MWHMPHGIDLPAIPKSNYSCYLLYEQPSLARNRSFTHIHFYCCKQLLGRNNTATTSAPHERCQHLFKGGLLLSYNATDSRLFLLFFLSPLMIPSWQLSHPYQDISSQLCTSQFKIYSSYIRDWSGTLFKKFVLATSRRSKGTHASYCAASDLHPSCTPHDSRLVAGSSF